MLILKEKEVFSLLSNLSPEEARRLLHRLHDVLREFSRSHHLAPEERNIHQPERAAIVTKLGNTSLFMPCSLTTSTAVKVVTLDSGGSLKGAINVFTPEGDLVGVLNAMEVTAFRTSLAVMIPYVRFVHKKTNIVVFGAGRQAEWHVNLALLLSKVDRVTVVNRSSPRRMEQLFAKLSEAYPGTSFNLLLKTDVDYDAHLRRVLTDADVIFCCTPATTPHFPYTYLDARPRFISLIGSYKPSMQEVDSRTLLSGGRIYVDTKEGCLTESGELINANVTKDQLVEVGELENDEPLQTEGNLVFKCVGLGLMDITIARELLTMAEKEKMGFSVDDF
ncbi:hypothetical protein HRR83_001890 [Exophiala dermatitidis]|uniref:Ornithine cyclodeaminase n=2 Tax=Exophiala dermatitidis TaxID=5970 RepID=H6C7M1_EXODN|nr:ornithine cyclodeaminase [Exophiala dermatitidis NIH/UT8656]KAJ4516556.1 hypothetical protein HRR73_005021 [Exophiala dermatitidis]EHY58851.1 ornithine cyclodeaminase [Exophiala dermatitidis NIH/UT8656]KAJ4523344.1 hypothetical protein HRR75_001745 [Exophiala dermatitidis]KAJ4526693.1 hypothetical protein HRR74_001893 [Exophiala dermatitidis]KAJ4532054.1 hypothetical protein HRR76_007057 [Exophiala dermatitidis]